MLDYKVTVRGVVSGSPQQFAIDIGEGEAKKLFHFNPRWSEDRIVMNACENDAWGAEESLPIGAYLRPGTPFVVEITDKDGMMIVHINGQPAHQFVKRINASGPNRQVEVRKADQGDVQLQLVQVDILGGGIQPALLNDYGPLLPYKRMVSLPGMVPYKVTLHGLISTSPEEFAVEVYEGAQILLHFNPRWIENRIVLNHCDSAGNWGPEENASTSMLTPGSPFLLEIVDQGPGFHITWNGQPLHVFHKRIHPASPNREIAINKVDQGDINVQHVQLEVMGGAVGMGGPGFQPYAM
jgi:hypothetical protein